jgi:DNA-binding protein H-NS
MNNTVDIELSGYSIPQLNDLGKKVAREIKTRQAVERKERDRLQAEKKRELFKRMKEMAANAGLTVDDVIAAAPRGLRSTKTTTSKSPAKYRNPNDPMQTWTGKGRKPRWMAEALERGVQLEEMEIR